MVLQPFHFQLSILKNKISSLGSDHERDELAFLLLTPHAHGAVGTCNLKVETEDSFKDRYSISKKSSIEFAFHVWDIFFSLQAHDASDDS